MAISESQERIHEAATAKDSSAVVPNIRSRRHSPKVRTGCVTCKARRVKCDEAKPDCRRCTSTGRKCNGYTLLKPRLFEISQDSEERWGFHYFRTRTTAHLDSFTDHEFWNGLVVRAGYSRKVVRHALVAIGSYHEGVDAQDHLRRIDRQRFALQQYNEAIKMILKSGNGGGGVVDAEDVLLASILFMFFENVRGAWTTALDHLLSALRVLSEWRARRSQNSKETKSESSSMIEDHLAPILARLYVSAATLLPLIPEKRKVYTTDLPDQFVSLQDSRFYLYELLHAVCAKLQKAPEMESWPCANEKVIDTGRQLLVAWYGLFDKFLRDTSHRICSCAVPESSCHFEIGAFHIEMQFWAAMIRLECKPVRSEMIFDQHIAKFRAVVNLTKGLVEKLNTPEAEGASTCLEFDPHYLPIMGFVALRCRDPNVRREAISLLRANHRVEGVWDNRVIADLTESIMVREEASGVHPRPATYQDIPESGRLLLLSCSFFSHNKAKDKLEFSYDLRNPELIKARMLRPGIKSGTEQQMETIWVDRRLERNFDIRKIPLPDDVSGLFPQTVDHETNLWRVLRGKKVAQFLERATASHIFPMGGRTTKTVGDLAIANKFRENLNAETESN